MKKFLFLLCILFLILSSGIAGAQSFLYPIEDARVAQRYAEYGKYVSGKYHTGMDFEHEIEGRL